LKWSWVGHIACQNSEKWTIRVILWRPRESTRSRGKPQEHWIEDINEEVGGSWFQIAGHMFKNEWKKAEEEELKFRIVRLDLTRVSFLLVDYSLVFNMDYLNIVSNRTHLVVIESIRVSKNAWVFFAFGWHNVFFV